MSSMVRSNCGRFRVAGALLSAVVLAGVLACAGSAVREETPVSLVDSERIDDVLVESSGATTRITLLGPEQPVFTAFQQAEPERLTVELAGVDGQLAGGTIPVYDGTVEDITVTSALGGDGGPSAQVELVLAGAVDYDVRPGGGGLVIEVTRLSDMDAIDGEELADTRDPWAVTPEGDPGQDAAGSMVAEEPEEPALAALMLEPESAKQATVLERVEAERVGDGAIIRLVSDGMLQSASTFTLEGPARLVVDLPGVKSQVERERIEVGAPQASRIRVGSHSDKVRVVIDGGDATNPFDGRQVLPVSTGLVIGLGNDQAVETAMQAASERQVARSMPMEQAPESPPAAIERAEEPMSMPGEESSATATIFGVEFDMHEDNDRVVVLSDAPVDYLVYEPDPETVVLSIAGSVLDRDAAVRIAPEPGGPVSLVTAFDQPDLKKPEVRVVMKRAPNLKPLVTRQGSTLLLDFPRSGGQAATPPVLAMGENDEWGAAGATDPMGGRGAGAMGAEGMSMAEASDMGRAAPPASLAPAGSAAAAPMPAAPGAIDPPAAISILSEGGLMDGKEYVGRRISLDFKEVDIADVLRLIAEVSDLNVIAGDEVAGKVTIRLVDVPWDQALDVILLTKGLGFVRIGNVLRIAAADVIAQEEELRLQERRAKEKLEDLVVKLQPVNYADVKDISKMVNQLLTPRGSVNVDNRTNTLIIKDIASVIDEATALIKAVDTMTPQVMIEAKIVEASLDFSREFGAIWSFGTNPLTQSTLGGRDWIFTDGAGGLGNNVAIGNSITSFPNSLANIAATVLDSKFNIEAQLQAAEVNGDGKVISSPRIVTLDNSEAKIEQGVSIPFQTFENGDAQLEFVDAVLQLRTTPHITSDKSIIMEIEVSRNAPDDSVFTLTGSPAIAKNQVETETLVKDGQTLVLGGIYVVDKSERQSRVPYLHKVPFLGNAFKSQEYSDSRKELLIFVTPRIVQTPGAAS